jgi:hypothetical protein
MNQKCTKAKTERINEYKNTKERKCKIHSNPQKALKTLQIKKN